MIRRTKPGLEGIGGWRLLNPTLRPLHCCEGSPMKRREACCALRIRRHNQLSAAEALRMSDDPVDPAFIEVWHLWFVLFPRRSITGKLVRGLVWRRRNGPRWIYKRFTEAEPSSDPVSPALADAHIPDHSKRESNNAPVR